MQVRINVFGDLIETTDLATMAQSLFSPGRLLGNEFAVASADILRVNPGSCLLPDGVLISEDTAKELVIPNSSYPAEYTILYQLEDSRVLGGSPAILKSVAGLIRQEAYTDATVIGWIKYPGGSIPLATTHFIQPDSLRIQPNVADLYQTYLAPFPQMIRPEGETKGVPVIKTLTLSDINVTQSQTVGLGIRGRLLKTSIVLASNLDAASKLAIEVKKGSTTLLKWDTNITKEGGIDANTPAYFVVPTTLTPIPLSTYIFEETDVLTVSITKTGSISDTFPAQINFSIESPASSGNWSESIVEIGGEKLLKFVNTATDTVPKYYTFQIPFVVTTDGEPKKLVSRMSAESNCFVIFKIKIAGNTITLAPSSGVTNTGGVITLEFPIPTAYTSSWISGTTAYLEITLLSDIGKSASFAHISLNAESSPFMLFTN